MRAKRLGKWLSNSSLRLKLKDEKILEWLHEEGSITKKISAEAEFRLEVLNDGLGRAQISEYTDMNIDPQLIRIMEVGVYTSAPIEATAETMYFHIQNSKQAQGVEIIVLAITEVS